MQRNLVDASTILLVRAGSHAYGTNTPTSDLDVRGIMIPPSDYYLGMKRVEQYQEAGDGTETKPDLVVYELRKYLNLAADANPNILELLFCDDSDVLKLSPAGEMLRASRHLFLSKKARHTFSGYAMSQLKKIESHRRWLLHPPSAPPCRADFGLPERTVIPADQLAAATAMMMRKVADWENTLPTFGVDCADEASTIAMRDRIVETLTEIHAATTDERVLAAGRVLGFDDNFLDLLDRERRYEQKRREWDSFKAWKATRNEARSELECKYGYDCYTDDTEFLTEAGWKKYDDILPEDKLATIFTNQTAYSMAHRTELGIEYQSFVDRFEGTYTGDLYAISGTHLDLLVTPNHRMLIRRKERRSGQLGDWELREAAHLPDSFEFLHTVEPCERTFGTSENFEELPLPVDTYMRVMGWYLAEGSVGRGSDGQPDDVRISQKEGGRLHTSMQKFTSRFKDLGVSLYHHKRLPNEFRNTEITEATLSIRHPQIVSRLYSDCGSVDTKRIPRWVFTLSKRLKEILFDAMAAGDGTVRKTGKNSTTYYTKLSKLADDVQELALSCGWETSKYGPYEYDYAQCAMYHVHVYKEASRTRTLIRSSNVKKVPVVNKRIVCFTVPNGTLVVRRNGHPSFQGNSKHGMHLVRLMRTCAEILTSGTVLVKRPDAAELLSIRQGAWSYERLIGWARDQDAKMAALAAASTLPHSPDREAIGTLCESLLREGLGLCDATRSTR